MQVGSWQVRQRFSIFWFTKIPKFQGWLYFLGISCVHGSGAIGGIGNLQGCILWWFLALGLLMETWIQCNCSEQNGKSVIVFIILVLVLSD